MKIELKKAKDAETGEYLVKVFKNDKYSEAATYFCDDKKERDETLKQMVVGYMNSHKLKIVKETANSVTLDNDDVKLAKKKAVTKTVSDKLKKRVADKKKRETVNVKTVAKKVLKKAVEKTREIDFQWGTFYFREKENGKFFGWGCNVKSYYAAIAGNTENEIITAAKKCGFEKAVKVSNNEHVRFF